MTDIEASKNQLSVISYQQSVISNQFQHIVLHLTNAIRIDFTLYVLYILHRSCHCRGGLEKRNFTFTEWKNFFLARKQKLGREEEKKWWAEKRKV